MNFKVRVLRGAALFCVCLLPKVSFGTAACTTATVASLLGTSCSIGDVDYAFIANSFGSIGTIAVTADGVTLTPDGSDPLNPQLSLTLTSGGPFSATAAGVGNSNDINFSFFWDATILTSGLQFGSVTGTLVNPVVPATPSFGFLNGGNNVGFSNPIVETGGPNANPSTVTLDVTSLTPPVNGPDGAFVNVAVTDGTGSGATASFDSSEIQYHLTPTPEPSSLLLLGTGLLGVVGALRRRVESMPI